MVRGGRIDFSADFIFEASAESLGNRTNSSQCKKDKKQTHNEFTDSNGCDSIVATNLSVLPPVIGNISLIVCAGDSIYAGGNWQTASGIYYDTLAPVSGCDSVVQTSLTVLPSLASISNMNICANDSLYAGGNWQTTSGTYYDTLIAASGCDSVITTLLNVNPVCLLSVSASVCKNDSILLGGAYQHLAGIYYDTLVTQSGCDSILVTTLSTYAADTSVSMHGDTLTANATGTTFQWIDCTTGLPIPGATNSTFAPVSAGSYAVVVTENSCTDTSSCYTLTGLMGNEIEPFLEVYPNPVNDLLNIVIKGNTQATVEYRLINLVGEQVNTPSQVNDRTIKLYLENLPSGAYFLEVRFNHKALLVKVVKS